MLKMVTQQIIVGKERSWGTGVAQSGSGRLYCAAEFVSLEKAKKFQ